MGVLEEDAAIWVEGKTERREGMTAGADLAVHSYRPRNTPQLGTRSGRRGDVDVRKRQSIKGDVTIIARRSMPKFGLLWLVRRSAWAGVRASPL